MKKTSLPTPRRWSDGDKTLPLYGIPVTVKDNIDVAGLPTTAACPAYLYRAKRDATAVARLRAAGALILGKTNLDQFATGLVGVRSPYGIGRNLFDAKTHPGRIEQRFGAFGRRRHRAAVARHRHRGLGPGAGDVRQYCRAQAEPRAGLHRGRRAGVPDARLRFDLFAHRRRCGDGAARSSPAPIRPIRIRARGRCAR